MAKLRAKLIVSDFDGTLITGRQQVPAAVKNAIERYVQSGGVFAVCTGRILASILPQVRALGLSGLVAACQGTVIADINSGEIIRSGGLSFKDASSVCAALEGAGAAVNVYSGDELYTGIPKDNEYLKIYEKITGIDAIHVDIPLSQYVMQNGLTCQKVASLCFPEDRERLYDMLRAEFDGRFDVTCSAKELVEVSPAGDTKGFALKYIAARYGIDISETVAVGDNLNDLSMIEAAGIGVAVGNADPALKRAAKFIAVTNEEGAVAQVINTFGYRYE